MRRFGFVLAALSLVSLLACTSEEAPVAGVADSTPATDPLSGTWTGDWGLTEKERNLVTLDLTWNGTALTGTLNPGTTAVPITKASFAQDTGMVTMEASTESAGKPVDVSVEGKLSEGSIVGTWTQDDKKGDFKVNKS